MRSDSNITNNCRGALITGSLRWGVVNDDVGGYYYYYYYYYYYIITTDSAAIIIIVIFDLNISECMIMIYLEINGPITVFKVLWV